MIMKLLQLKICNWLGKENVSCQLFKWCAKHTSREETYMIENVRSLAFDTIQDILNEGAYSNLRINEVLSENELNAMDKALFTEIVYGTVKRKYTLDFYLKPFVKTKIKAWVRQLLWMSIYQYVYLDKVPNHAIINEAVEIAKERGGYHNGNVVNGILRTMMRSDLPDFNEIADPKKEWQSSIVCRSGL